MSNIRVGLIGVNADRGWAREAHVPAIRAAVGLELAAVATRREESAAAAAAAFDVPKAYGDPKQLIEDPNIDVVAIASSVATHQDLIDTALVRGKHVLTEWPLAVGTTNMTSLAAAARSAATHTAVSLQSRKNPSVLRAVDVLESGAIGRVLAVRVFSSTAGFGAQVDEENSPLEDPSAGMHLLTIQAAHTLDLLAMLVGAPAQLSAVTTIRFPELARPSGGTMHRVLPDHVLVQGRLHGGGAFSVEVQGGREPDDTPFRLVIEGTGGTLELRGGAPRGFQSGVLEMSLDGRVVSIGGGSVETSVVNVLGVYEALRDDVLNGGQSAPSFDDAVRLSSLLDDVRRSDADGISVALSSQWPSRRGH